MTPMKTIHFFIIVFVGAVLGFLPLRTAGATSLFRLEDQGNFQLDSMRFGWILYPPGWNAILLDRNSFRIDAGFPHRREGRFEVKGKWAGFHVAVSAAEQRNRIQYRAAFHADPPVDAATLALTTNLDTAGEYHLEIDGRKLALPKQFQGTIHLFNGIVKKFSFDCGGNRVHFSGRFRLLIQDDRKWRINRFLVRISPEPSRGKLKDTTLDLNIRIDLPETRTIDLRAAANRGFRDEKPNDGRGGWTDQGPDNDLGMIRPGVLTALGVPFEIIDPAANGGRGCIALSAAEKNYARESSVSVADALPGAQYLYLLHCSAWTPSSRMRLGEIEVEFTDGKRKNIPVISSLDVGNWWAPYAFPNAAVAYLGENAHSVVGLYLSQFALEKPPRRLTFRATPARDAVWLIAGATLGNRKLNLSKVETPSYLVEDKDWAVLNFSGKTLPGSPLDFSRYLDAPAGKYGPVMVDAAGHFVFRDAPEKRIRFFGPNLVGGSHYVSRKTADDFVNKVSLLGYNTVRFHHYEAGLIDYTTPSSVSFRAKRLDCLNYLFAELKKRGLYLSIDLYASRPLRDGDNIVERRGIRFRQFDFEMKNLLPISESAMANWKEFARRLLTQVNPYTGLTWAEDPALASVNLVNENPLVTIWNKVPQLIPLYEKKYVEFLQRRNLDTPENRESRGGLFIEFLTELQINCQREQRRFLREELKLSALITDMNMTSKFTLIEPRAELDFVDNHRYWDHPSFPVTAWELPYLFGCLSSIRQKAESPRYLMPARLFGKPYTVTEFNFCNPNPYRMEGGALFGAYAGLQDWDGLYRFAWSHYAEKMSEPAVPIGFDIVNDPFAQLEERIIRMLFVRGDVAAAQKAFAFTVTPGELLALNGPPGNCGDYPDRFSELGLYARIGSLPRGAQCPGVKEIRALAPHWQKSLPASVRAAMKQFERSGSITSETGEITLNSKSLTLGIVTPRSEVATFRGNAEGKIMTLRNGTRYQTVALMSLDDLPLRESASILLIQLPNFGATKQKFANGQRKQLESWGEFPLLVERAAVDVVLELPGRWKVEALQSDGAVLGPVSTVNRNGKLCFQAATTLQQGGVLCYHLSRQKP